MRNLFALSAFALLAGCSNAMSAELPAQSQVAENPAPAGSNLVRNNLDDIEFQELFPGVAVHFVYGGIGLGVPTAQLGRIDAGLTFPAHSHSDDYHAVLIKGNFQHWEEGDADKGPVMTPGATFFQGRDVPHYDSCLGPEQCLVYVTFAERADVTMAPRASVPAQ